MLRLRPAIPCEARGSRKSPRRPPLLRNDESGRRGRVRRRDRALLRGLRRRPGSLGLARQGAAFRRERRHRRRRLRSQRRLAGRRALEGARDRRWASRWPRARPRRSSTPRGAFGGDPSWKDFTWDAIGVVAGLAIAWGVDLLLGGVDAAHPALGAAPHGRGPRERRIALLTRPVGRRSTALDRAAAALVLPPFPVFGPWGLLPIAAPCALFLAVRLGALVFPAGRGSDRAIGGAVLASLWSSRACASWERCTG